MRFPLLQFVVVAMILAGAFAPAAGDEADDQYAVSAGLYARQQWESAAREFGTFLDRFPNHAKADQVVFFMAEALLRQNELDKASSWFAEYLRRSPEGPHARSSRFRLAETAYLARRFDEAGEALEEFRRDHPDDARADYVLAYLGEIALARGDDDEAVARFREALTRGAAGTLRNTVRLGLARAFERLGRSDEASNLYHKLIAEKLGTLSDEARFRLGAMHHARGSHAEAVATLLPLEESRSAGDWRPPGRLVRGLSLRNMARYDQAAALLGSLTTDPRLGAEAQYWLAAVYRDRRQWDDAAAMLLSAAEQFPDHRLTGAMRLEAGNALLNAGKTTEAGEQFDLVIGGGQANVEWLDGAALGKLQLAQLAGDHAAVDRQVNQFLADFPDSRFTDDARYLWTRSLVARGEHGRAVEPLEKLLADAPREDLAAWARVHLVVGLAKLGRWKTADEALTRLLAEHAKHPGIASALESYAEAAYERREYDRAERLFEMLIERGDDRRVVDRAISGLGWTRLGEGRFAEALAQFENLLERKPEASLAADAAWAGAHALERLGRDDEALTMYAEAIERKPDDGRTAKILLSIARLHRRLNQDERAAAIYARLVADFPDYDQLDAVLYEWSWLLSDEQSDDKAAECLDRLHREHRDSRYWTDATYRLAQRALEAGDRAAAERLIDAVLAAGEATEIEEYALALKWRIAAAFENWEVVGTTAERLIDRFPNSSFRAAARFWLGESLYRRGDHDRAAEVLESLAEETVEEKPSWLAMAPLRRAQIHALRKEWLDAYELASSIRRDYPDFECLHEADYVIGRALAARAEFDAAREAYRRVICSPRGAKTETAAMAQWMIGETYFHQKNHEAAIREYLRVDILYDYPRWQAAALLQAGKCCEQLGRADEAAKIHERLAKDFPDTQFADEARAAVRR